MANKSNRELAQCALDNHLYVGGWFMQHLILETLATQKKQKENSFVILYHQEALPQTNPLDKTKYVKKAVACGIYERKQQTVSIYVKPKYRKYGYGSQILQKLLRKIKKQPTQVLAGIGIGGSDKFFEKNGVFSFDLNTSHFFGFYPAEAKAIQQKTKTVKEIILERQIKNNKTTLQKDSIDEVFILDC